jgi:hypothetical protein
MRTRVAAIVALVVGITAILAIGSWWYVKDHVRISPAAVQSTVATRAGGTAATCDRKDKNAAHWLCAVAHGPGARDTCMKVHVRPWGSVDLVNGYLKCEQDPVLTSLFTVKKAVKKKQVQKAHQRKKHQKQNAA